MAFGFLFATRTVAAQPLIIPGDASSAVPESERISLDPICETMEPPTPRLAPGNPAPSTVKMARFLERFSANAQPESTAYMSDRLVSQLRKQVLTATNLNQVVGLNLRLAANLMYAGRPDSALNTYVGLEKILENQKMRLNERSAAELNFRKALAFLRLGEQENCLVTDSATACLFPLRPGAYHVLPRGSKGAIELFSEHLQKFPNDLSAKWLLNVAHMTLGEHPDKVKPEHLIPAKVFASEYDMPTFPDVAKGVGLDANDLAGGVIVDDFDNDGLYDVVISAWDHQGQLRFFKNKGDGTFIDRTSEAGLVGEVCSLNIQQTDYNNDGFLDIWMLRGAWLNRAGRMPNSLLRNNGDGTFTDVTEEAGLLSLHPTISSTWFDFDGDGWLDVFIGNESVDPNKDPDWSELYRNNRNGTFTECARQVGIRMRDLVKGVTSADYNNDGRPDLFLSVRGEPNKLYRNDGPSAAANGAMGWKFTDVTTEAGIVGPIASFGTFFFDFNNDGWQDILAFGYSTPGGVGDIAADYLGLKNEGERTQLYRNNRDGTFTDIAREANIDRVVLTMGHNFGDIDNDGWLDMYCGTGDPDFTSLIPNRMFRNNGGKMFQDVTTATATGHLQKGHGIAFADFDDDGDQDIYASMGGAFTADYARNVLFENPTATNHWVKLKLVGVKANRAAIGARLKLIVTTPSGSREIHRVVNSGGSFGSSPLRQEIGLGDAQAIAKLEIRWPGSSEVQTIEGLKLDHSYQITEGKAEAVSVKLNPVRLARPRAKELSATLRK